MDRERLKVAVRGAVQGVGFRPFVYRLATELDLKGWVSNSSQGVLLEVEGGKELLRRFQVRLEKEKPPRAMIQSFESSFHDAIGYDAFQIRESEDSGEKTTLILPDIATCRDCLAEITDPANRRFGYPFTNCTNCGPRFSIIQSLPYDRANTSMKNFVMCAECDREYRDPPDRRFHAQPNACPRCGPQLQLWDETGVVLCSRDDALVRAADMVRAGKILALKGIGGFQLIVDARNENAVLRLRARKHREEKPFAAMFPSLDAVHEICAVSELEERLLLSPESPIALLSRRSSKADRALAGSLAPGNPNLGVILPYTPLHHLLLRELSFPVVATSGNLSDEPICIDEQEARQRLHDIADTFLVHDRPIVRHVDDSIVRVMCGRELVLRRARGYAPLPITIKSAIRDHRPSGSDQPTILAVGAHLKNAVALSIDNNVFMSQHIGDLETAEAFAAFQRAAEDLPRLYGAKIDVVACDLHPDYLSTKFAAQSGLPNEPIQHHWAHVVACMAENEIDVPALGVALDGTGYGLDQTIWGGEFLFGKRDRSFERVAHFRQFRLPGGDQAVREPRRSALGILYEIFGDELWQQPALTSSFNENELSVLRQMLEKKVNAPLTSSVGRLFDAVASLIGLRHRVTFEGQAAMELEFTAQADVREAYPFDLHSTAPIVIDWQPSILGLLDDIKKEEPVGVISAKFHNLLSQVITTIARKIGEPKVVLTGGCFQNRYLCEHTVDQLRQQNFRPYWHQRIPPNDGGIGFGQAVATIRARQMAT